jgi:opacity protein-like surface antigen
MFPRVRPAGTACLIAAASALSLASGTAAATEPGFYAGVGVGEAMYSDVEELNNLCTDYGITCTVDDKDTAYKVFAGYQFNNFIALEAAWVDLGTLTAEASVGGPATIEADVAGLALHIVPQIPIGDIGSVFGKAGVLIWNGDAKAAAPSFGLEDSASETGAGLTLGVGAAVNFTDNVTLRVEYERFSLDEEFTIEQDNLKATNDVDLLSASVLMRFH